MNRNQPLSMNTIIAQGKLRRGIASILKFIALICAVLCVRFCLYRQWAGWDLDEALLKDIGISDYVGVWIGTLSDRYLDRFVLENWLTKLVKNRVVPLNLLFEEAVLNRLVKTPSDLMEMINRGQKAGILDHTIVEEVRDAFQLMSKPRPTRTTGSVKIGYNIQRDYIYLALIVLLPSICLYYTSYGLILLILGFVFLGVIIHRMNRFGANTWLEVSADGILFGDGNEMVSWDYINQVDVKKQSDKKYVVVPYVLCIQFNNGAIEEVDIRAFQGGWRKVYRTVKGYAPIPVALDVIDN